MSLENLPDEVIYCVLPLLKLKDALAFGRTNKRMHALTVGPLPSTSDTRTRSTTGLRGRTLLRTSGSSTAATIRAGFATWPWASSPPTSFSTSISATAPCSYPGAHLCSPSCWQPTAFWAWMGTGAFGRYVSSVRFRIDTEGCESNRYIEDWDRGVTVRRSFTGRCERIDLPFAVADFATDKCYLTVLTTEDEVWDVPFDPSSGPRERPPSCNCHKPFSKNKTCASMTRVRSAAEQETGNDTSRVVQVLAYADGNGVTKHYLSGFVTADGRVHAWDRTRRLSQRSHLARGPITGSGNEAMAVSEALPGFRTAVLCDTWAMALTHDGRVWFSRIKVLEGESRGPDLKSMAFDAWEEVSRSLGGPDTRSKLSACRGRRHSFGIGMILWPSPRDPQCGWRSFPSTDKWMKSASLAPSLRWRSSSSRTLPSTSAGGYSG